MLDISTVTCHVENEEILYIRWEDYDPFMKFNFEMYFFNLIAKINRLGIKKLILDCSERKHDPSEKDFKDIYELFLSGLSSTNLEKMARVRPRKSPTNSRFDKLLEQTKSNLNLTFEMGCFNDVDSAFAWLRKESLILGNNSKRTA
jgi:hypothetical protein